MLINGFFSSPVVDRRNFQSLFFLMFDGMSRDMPQMIIFICGGMNVKPNNNKGINIKERES
jgi:hypothetical protein